jgi:hypothetical protein
LRIADSRVNGGVTTVAAVVGWLILIMGLAVLGDEGDSSPGPAARA